MGHLPYHDRSVLGRSALHRLRFDRPRFGQLTAAVLADRQLGGRAVRVTGLWGFLGLVAIGWIIADGLAHPAATEAAGTDIVSLEKNTGNQVAGVS
jgi:hypothetical protein